MAKVKCTKVTPGYDYWTEGEIYDIGQGMLESTTCVNDDRVHELEWYCAPFKHDQSGTHYRVTGLQVMAEFVEYHEDYPL